jgi:pimeloyl-ACP methyl ester carboxylesterase
MGGHVASELIENYGHKVTKMVALSSPQTKFWALPLISHFYNSPVIEDFGTSPIWPKNIPILNIYGQLDILANPASPLLARDKDPRASNIRSMKIPYHSHLSILWSAKTAAEIYAFCTYEDSK